MADHCEHRRALCGVGAPMGRVGVRVRVRARGVNLQRAEREGKARVRKSAQVKVSTPSVGL